MTDLAHTIDLLAKDDVHYIDEGSLLIRAEELLSERARLDGEICRTLQALDVRQITASHCGRTTRGWLVEEQHLADGEARTRMWASRALVGHPLIADALAAGDITYRHATDILGCLGKLTPQWREAAEQELVAFARDNDPTTLGQLFRALLVRTGADEDVEQAAQRMYESRWATLSKTFEGMWHLDAMLHPEAGAAMAAALASLMSRGGEEDTRNASQRRADALEELAHFALEHGQLPDHNGERPQLTATIPWDELRRGIAADQLGSATFSGEIAITPHAARRLACDAEIIPAVLGGDSEVLDLGRSQRIWSRSQRRAARLRDHGCVFPDCQAGLERCQLHHLQHWADGGPSDYRNSAHLCRFHHWLVHHRNWSISRDPSGQIEVRRT